MPGCVVLRARSTLTKGARNKTRVADLSQANFVIIAATGGDTK